MQTWSVNEDDTGKKWESLTGHLVNKADIFCHGGDHVVQGVLLHLDGGVGHQDERVSCCSIRRQHVVYLWVHT